MLRPDLPAAANRTFHRVLARIVLLITCRVPATIDAIFRLPQTGLAGRGSGPGTAFIPAASDALGRVATRSVPYLSASADPYKVVTYSYDALNRLTKAERQVSEADSSLQSTQWSFNGLSITETNALAQATTRKLSAIGQAIQVIDAAGSDTDYEYDAFGNLLKTRDVMSNEIALGYNIRGFKTSSSDPDLGSWSYDYFPLGELKSRTNARAQTANFTYDKLSRPLTRVEPEGTTTWTWGTSAASHNIGHLASVSSPGSYSETYTYDSLARLSQTAIVADGSTYTINQSYDAATGFQDTLTYPTSTSGVRIKLKYGYQNGYLNKVNDFTGNVLGTKYWEALATNARGAVIDEELGNGLRTFSKYDHIAGFLDYRQTGPGGGSATLNLDYAWDKLGNLTQRQDLNLSLTEGFVYDNLNRLDYTTGVSSLNVDYDAIGRISLKSDVGSYSYHATKKHAVIAAGSNSYAYDANGNLQTRNGKTITWTSYDLPSLIQPSTDTNYNQFFYDAWRQRYKQVYKAGTPLETTIYVGGILEKWVRGSTTQWRHLIQANGRTVALLNRSGTTNTVRYPLEDHLSGMAVLTTSAGGVYVKESFDAFGRRRNPATWVGAPSSADLTLIRDASRHGFTFHEHLDNTALIHMNGRVQDPGIGRFLSADPYVPEPFDGQSFNRYSYVDNNPLSFIDPSGFAEEKPLHHDFANVIPEQLFGWVEWLNWQQRDPVDRIQAIASTQQPCDQNTPCQNPAAQSTAGGASLSDFLLNSTREIALSYGEDSWSLAYWNVLIGGFTDAANDALHGDYTAAAIGIGMSVVKPARVFKHAARATTHMHHLLPQAKRFEQFFKRAGLDIEDFKIPLDKARHTLKPDGIHTNSGGNWNKVWDGFFQANPNATRQEILDQLARMRRDFGI